MGNWNWQYIIDGAAALYGLYVLLSAIKMKAKEEVSSFLASPEEMFKCKDKKGFIAMVANRMIVFGVVTLLYGVCNMINEYRFHNTMFGIASLGVFLLSCGLFIGLLRKAREQYLNL